jgi:hypothetical protein
MKTLIRSLFVFAIFFPAQSLLAQAPDNRFWPKNTKQLNLIDYTWIEVPRNTSHSGAFVRWPAVQGFAPNINALFETFNGNIRQYRAAALPIIKNMGMKILRDRVIYERIWETESTARFEILSKNFSYRVWSCGCYGDSQKEKLESQVGRRNDKCHAHSGCALVGLSFNNSRDCRTTSFSLHGLNQSFNSKAVVAFYR